jgi:hypothetical protein
MHDLSDNHVSSGQCTQGLTLDHQVSGHASGVTSGAAGASGVATSPSSTSLPISVPKSHRAAALARLRLSPSSHRAAARGRLCLGKLPGLESRSDISESHPGQTRRWRQMRRVMQSHTFTEIGKSRSGNPIFMITQGKTKKMTSPEIGSSGNA